MSRLNVVATLSLLVILAGCSGTQPTPSSATGVGSATSTQPPADASLEAINWVAREGGPGPGLEAMAWKPLPCDSVTTQSRPVLPTPIPATNTTVRAVTTALGLRFVNEVGNATGTDWQWQLQGGGVARRSLRWEFPLHGTGAAAAPATRRLLDAALPGLGIPDYVRLVGRVDGTGTEVTGFLRQSLTKQPLPMEVPAIVDVNHTGWAHLHLNAWYDVAASPVLFPGNITARAAEVLACRETSGNVTVTWAAPTLAWLRTGDRFGWQVTAAVPGPCPRLNWLMEFDALTGALLLYEKAPCSDIVRPT